MTDSEDFPDLNKDLLKAIDKAIKDGPWEEGVLFKTAGNKLRELRKELEENLILESTEEVEERTIQEKLGTKDFVEVYISLYVSGGNAMSNWEHLLHSLSQQTVSRPMYLDESAVKAMIRSKTNKVNEAYVAVLVHKDDFVEPYQDKIPKDRQGNELLLVKEGAIDPSHITRFIHLSGEYQYRDGKLMRQMTPGGKL